MSTYHPRKIQTALDVSQKCSHIYNPLANKCLQSRSTGQSLSLGFDRERMWYELLRAGYTLQDLRAVIVYLQREIRAQRRNVGALKLSNLLQPDRFD